MRFDGRIAAVSYPRFLGVQKRCESYEPANHVRFGQNKVATKAMLNLPPMKILLGLMIAAFVPSSSSLKSPLPHPVEIHRQCPSKSVPNRGIQFDVEPTRTEFA